MVGLTEVGLIEASDFIRDKSWKDALRVVSMYVGIIRTELDGRRETWITVSPPIQFFRLHNNSIQHKPLHCTLPFTTTKRWGGGMYAT